MARVKTLVEGYTGFVGADQFVNGECVVPDDKLAYYERQGYIIIRDGDYVGNSEVSKPDDSEVSKPDDSEVSKPDDSEVSKPDSPIMPSKDALKSEWEAFAQSVGVDLAGKTKNEIIDAVKEAMQPVSDNQG